MNEFSRLKELTDKILSRCESGSDIVYTPTKTEIKKMEKLLNRIVNQNTTGGSDSNDNSTNERSI